MSSPGAEERAVSAAGGPGRFGRLLDACEYCLLLGAYAWLIVRIVVDYQVTHAAVNFLLLPSEGLVVLLVLIRRRTGDVSRRWGDWLLALAATAAPLLVAPDPKRALVPPVYVAIGMLAGFALQITAKLALGRSFGCVPAHRGLKTGGPYAYVRHPIYAGYLLMHISFWLVNASGWNLGLYLFCYAMQIPRLLAEERLLAEDPIYQQYMSQVPYRLVPWVF